MDATTLLQHRDFMLRVARAMLRDEADVEDVVQDSYVAALQSAPPRTGRVRPWLGGITRNLARNLNRSEGRRRAREERVARPEGVEESADRLRWQQRVVEAVLALEPPYRDVIVLRYLEELPPREVATRLDVPVNTVRTRTRRAVEQLRGVFDNQYGGRAAWSAAIGGLFFAKAASASKLLVAALLVAVTGATGALWHSSTRSEQVPTRRAESVASDGREESARTKTVAEAAAESAKRSRPTHFRGRIFPFGTGLKAPLADATVHLQHASRRTWLATTKTDAEGRFTIAWKSNWKILSERDYNQYLLYVVHDKRWSDPIYVHPDGFGDGYVARVVLEDNPRFQFVVGAGKRGIAGACVTLHRPPGYASIELGGVIGSAMTDREGFARPEWPSWVDEAVIRVERPGGDTLQWSMALQQARTYDPYDVALDGDDLATVRIQVVDRKGNPAANVRVRADGSWAPDGVSNGPYLRIAHGAEQVPLIGVTDRQGVATFRFPADRAREGIYLPHRMIAYRDHDGLPQFVEWVWNQRTDQEVEGARTGNTLRLLQFGVTGRERAVFALRGNDPQRELYVYQRGPGGVVHCRELGSLMRIGDFTFCRLLDGGRGEIGILTHLDDERIGWARLDEAQFARCVSGEAVVEPCAPKQSIEFTIRYPKGHPSDEAWLEAVDVPFSIGSSVSPGDEEHFLLPNIPGKWRVRFGRESTKSVLFDPRKDSPYTLPFPPD